MAKKAGQDPDLLHARAMARHNKRGRGKHAAAHYDNLMPLVQYSVMHFCLS